jgi:hypothetical protein
VAEPATEPIPAPEPEPEPARHWIYCVDDPGQRFFAADVPATTDSKAAAAAVQADGVAAERPGPPSAGLYRFDLAKFVEATPPGGTSAVPVYRIVSGLARACGVARIDRAGDVPLLYWEW